MYSIFGNEDLYVNDNYFSIYINIYMCVCVCVC